MRHEITVLKGEPYPLGITVKGKDGINFAAVLPGKEEGGVILYPKRGGVQLRFPFPEENTVGNVRCMRLLGIRMQEYEYNFYVGEEVVVDPYARKLSGNERWGKRVDPALRCDILEGEFDWGTDRPLETEMCDSILYQLHVRGFTRHRSSMVKHKGTFLGIVEKIPYLKELGVTAVELMPAYEFVELERPKGKSYTMAQAAKHYMEPSADEEKVRINYWGYKNGFYFAPKASYCSTQDPVTEFKSMVRALHENGLEVIMQFYFPPGVGQGFILETLRFWVWEYHIDGAHLLGEALPTVLAATDPLLAKSKLFYYDFPCQEIYVSPDAAVDVRLACYRDDFLYDMRRFLKGDEDTLGSMLYQLRKNPRQMGAVNYIANYEGFSLADLVSYERKHNEENGEQNRDGNPYNASWNCGIEGKTRKKTVLQLRRKQMRNAVMLLFTAQGTPMLTAGDEFGHSREGNNNAYCQDNEVNWLNWKRPESDRDFLEFVKALIALRKAHPILHKPDEMVMTDFIACGYPELSYHGREAWRLDIDRISREAGVMYCGNYAKTDRVHHDDFFYIAYNMHWEEKKLALPALPAGMHWEKVLDSETAGVLLEPEEWEKSVTVPARSIRILKSVSQER